MKKTTTLLVAAFAFILSANAQAKWGFDKSHSSVSFSIAHMVISETTGQFKDYEGTVTASKDDFSDAQVELTIQATSIDTDDEKRDGHLRAPDFFDVEKFPTITFKSTKMEAAGDNMYKLHGELTMHGVTKAVVLDAKYGGTVNDPWGNTKAGFKVSGTLNRTDFDLKYNSVMEAGGLMIGEEVEITCKMELVKMK